MSDHVLKAFEAAFGVWTTTGYFKHKPTQHQLDGFRKGYAIAEQASADRIAQLEKALAAQNHIPDLGKMVRAQPTQVPAGKNAFGLDARYFHEKLSLILRDIGSYKPEEMHRELSRLADVVAPSQTQEPKSKPVANLNDLQIDEIARQVLDRVTHEWEGLQPWVYVFARKIESASRQLLGNPEQFKPPAPKGEKE